ncbi:nicotinate mononucleotide-dependent phosphoribosyltransferase CobT [Merismopedia glauca]|uniref:UPF0284 protein C7B64_23495 n=1 Tax=Merismopedia glauca CCAP 1448/3 TaxID=1296344 RepID=A0A2T1BWQ5_9CYAN|nr:TIGR00303 family protein [Merismopedia glauca]PSB00446.1 TIGR00303 family protein [Merismopedia glauca CCAP 1448/3]
MIEIYSQVDLGERWLEKYRGCQPVFACVLGFTETCLIEGISAAGLTPSDRLYTAVADAEFLYNGCQKSPRFALPPLTAGASPVVISRAVVEGLNIPTYLFNAGLSQPPSVPTIDLGGLPAKCLTSGAALPLNTVKHLFEQGQLWGAKLANEAQSSYLILSECVVGGTTTALAILSGLGISARDKVNSSHPQCNHAQKWDVVQKGLKGAVFSDPFALVAAVGDPMQIVVAGMALAASNRVGVLLAGGTQMLAVYALIRAIALHLDTGTRGRGDAERKINSLVGTSERNLSWQPEQIVVGTTKWVAADPTGDTVGLAEEIGNVSLIATQLSFATSSYPQLQVYEQGFVKEGVGAGGLAIASHLYQGWSQAQLLQAIENLLKELVES